jgi:hypothetical protein
MLTFPEGLLPSGEPVLALEPDPQPTENRGIAAIASPKKMRFILEFIFRLLRRPDDLHSLDQTKAGYPCAGSPDRAKIPASTLQNTQAGKELRRLGRKA